MPAKCDCNYKKNTHLIFIWVASILTNLIDFAICRVCLSVELQNSKYEIKNNRIEFKNDFPLQIVTWKYSTPVRSNNSLTVRNSDGFRWCSSRWSVSSLSIYQARTILRVILSDFNRLEINSVEWISFFARMEITCQWNRWD